MSLAVETRIFALNQNNGTGPDGAEWYYVTSFTGVTVIELTNKRKSVKLYNLGMGSYTFIGNEKK